MKRKFLITIYIIISALLISCREDVNVTTAMPSITNDIQIDYGVFELTSVSSYFDSYCGGLYGNEQEATEWVEIIESKYNIDVLISSVYEARKESVVFNFTYKSEEYDYIKKGIETGFISGLFYVYTDQMLKQLVENDLVIPVDQYLEKNENWGMFPSVWKNAYTLDGECWALPTRSEENIYLRQIRLDWLKTIGMAMPNTIADFRDVIYAFTYDDPDNDKNNNTSGGEHTGISGVEDIFNSFDARLSQGGYPGPVWNPNSNIWEDSVTKPEFRECLEFITECDSIGVFINNRTGEYDKSFYSGYSGTNYSANRYTDQTGLTSIPGTENGMADIGYILGLTHIIDKNITGVFTDYSIPVFLTINSRNPEDTINIYVNVFLSDFDGYIMGRYGSREKITVLDDNTIAYKSKDSEGNLNYWPGIVSYSPIYQYEQVAEYNTEIPENHRIKQEIIEENLGINNLFYLYPWNDEFLNFTGSKERLLRTFGSVSKSMISRVINGETNIDDALLEYEKNYTQYDIGELVFQLNEKTNN